MTGATSLRVRRGLARLAAGLTIGVVLVGCAGPVGTKQSDPTVVLRELGRSATTSGEPTWQTRNALLEQGLLLEFEERPEQALAALHQAMVAAGGDVDLLFALAELSFLHGQHTAQPAWELAAAVYAYAFLFPEGSGAAPGRFDPRLRIAAEWKPADLAAVSGLIAARRLSLDGLITHRAPARDAETAYRTAFTDPACLKMVLDWREVR